MPRRRPFVIRSREWRFPSSRPRQERVAIDVPSQLVSCDDQRIDVRINRIQERRHKEPRELGSILMHVIDDLRVPDVLNLTDR